MAHAFQVYTGRIGEWWDPNYSANPKSLRAVTIEPRVGGRVFASANEDARAKFGDWPLLLDRFAQLAEASS